MFNFDTLSTVKCKSTGLTSLIKDFSGNFLTYFLFFDIFKEVNAFSGTLQNQPIQI